MTDLNTALGNLAKTWQAEAARKRAEADRHIATRDEELAALKPPPPITDPYWKNVPLADVQHEKAMSDWRASRHSLETAHNFKIEDVREQAENFSRKAAAAAQGFWWYAKRDRTEPAANRDPMLAEASRQGRVLYEGSPEADEIIGSVLANA